MAAIEKGCPYYVYTPDLTDYVCLNVPTDPNFVGYVTDVSGLDDAGVRENAQVVVAGDGGHHGPFWRDRRPWTISGVVIPTMPVTSRDAAQEHIQKVLDKALRVDGYLKWLPADGTTRVLAFRKQQPMRISQGQSNIEKIFQIGGVAADWRITQDGPPQSLLIGQATGWFNTVPIVNSGDVDAAPIFTVTGPLTAFFTVTNVTTGKNFVVNQTLLTTDSVVIDLTAQYPTVLQNGVTDLSGPVDAIATDYSIAVAPGNNTFQLSSGGGTSSATTLTVQWRNSWI